jgi:hypothetical protein
MLRIPRDLLSKYQLEGYLLRTAMKNALVPWLPSALIAALLVAPASVAQTKSPSDSDASSASGEQRTMKEAVQPTKDQCIESHRQSQQAQNEGKLVHARELARTCTSLACPGLLVSDCARWLSDLDQRIPSVVFEVRLDGNPNRESTVLADGKVVEEWTRGESFRLDPGEHQFRFELPNHEPIVQNLMLAEGMRYRIVSADFKTPVEPAAPTTLAPVVNTSTYPQAPRERPTPFVVYPLLGVGVIGVAGFATFGLLGKSKQSDLEKSCSPDCSNDDLSPMKQKYLIGDIALGVGAASLITAGIIYLARPEKEAPATVGVIPLPGGAAGVASYRF